MKTTRIEKVNAGIHATLGQLWAARLDGRQVYGYSPSRLVALPGNVAITPEEASELMQIIPASNIDAPQATHRDPMRGFQR